MSKKMCSFIRGMFTNHILLKRKLLEFWCSMHQYGREVMNVHQLANQSFELAIDDQYSLQNISYTYVISFFVGFFVACGLLVVISSLTWVVEMCY